MCLRGVDVAQLANYLGFSTSAIRKWVRRGKIPFNKVNGGIRFDIERIEQWLDRERAHNLKALSN